MPNRATVGSVSDEVEIIGQQDLQVGSHAVRLTFGILGDRPELVGVEMWAIPKPTKGKWNSQLQPDLAPGATPERIKATSLRLRTDTLTKEWANKSRAVAKMLARPERTDIPKKWTDNALELLDQTSHMRRGGRPPLYSPDDYREVLKVYREARTARRPAYRAVAKYKNVSESAAAKLVSKAKDLENPGRVKQGRKKEDR